MDRMFDMKMTGMASQFGTALHQLENRLGTEIHRDREERKEEMKQTSGCIDEVLERLQKLEKREYEQKNNIVVEHAVGMGGLWKPTRMILGSENGHSRDDIVRKADKFNEKMGAEKNLCVDH